MNKEFKDIDGYLNTAGFPSIKIKKDIKPKIQREYTAPINLDKLLDNIEIKKPI